jgi:hypothetical protein
MSTKNSHGWLGVLFSIYKTTNCYLEYPQLGITRNLVAGLKSLQ